jgi:hypothetical protein
MNDRLIAEFLADAAGQPAGKRMHRLIALVAERCATILDIEADADPQNAARSAANTIRAAFVEAPQELKPAARAAAAHALTLANRRQH